MLLATFATFIGFTNKGAEALLKTRINSIRKHFPEAVFNVLVIYKNSCQPINGVTYIQTFGGQKEKFGSLAYLLKSLYSAFVWTTEAIRYRLTGNTSNPDIKLLAKSDLFISCDGDILGEDYGIFPYLWRLYYLSLGFILDKPVFIYAEGSGPFKSGLSKIISKWFFSKCAYVSVRDSISHKYLKSVNINNNVHLVADSAFLLEPSTDKKFKKTSKRRRIGIAVSKLATKYGFKSRKNSDPYESFIVFMAGVIDKMVDEFDTEIVLIPHVVQVYRDDYQTAKDIYHFTNRKDQVEIIDKKLNAQELKAIISQCDLIIASRMHAAIAGLSSFVPTIGLAYSHKMDGVLSDLGIKTVIGIKEVETKLYDLIKKTLKNSLAIRKYLITTIPRAQELAEEPSKFIASFILRSQAKISPV